MRLLYLIGVPGSGKTTAMRGALALLGLHRHPASSVPFAAELLLRTRTVGPSARVDHFGYHLGRERHPFGGTDTLPMNVQPKVLAWMADLALPSVVVGEGDRLGNGAFLDAARALGWQVQLVHLDVPSTVAEARRGARGTTQNATWLRGRHTKVARLGQSADVTLDGRDEGAPTHLARLIDPSWSPA